MSILFVHGAGDPNQDDGSFRFLERLKVPGKTQVNAPQLPNPDRPDASAWTEAIANEIRALDDAPTILTHSLGGSCTLAALSSMEPKPAIDSLILVAAPHWGRDPNWSAESFVLPKDYSNGLACFESIHLVYSEDDEVVPVTHMYSYLEDLPWAHSHLLKGVSHTFISGNIEKVDELLSSKNTDDA